MFDYAPPITDNVNVLTFWFDKTDYYITLIENESWMMNGPKMVKDWQNFNYWVNL